MKGDMLVVSGVLELFAAVTKHMGLYLDSPDDSARLYQDLNRLLQVPPNPFPTQCPSDFTSHFEF